MKGKRLLCAFVFLASICTLVLSMFQIILEGRIKLLPGNPEIVFFISLILLIGSLFFSGILKK